jgi:hypothetical protein
VLLVATPLARRKGFVGAAVVESASSSFGGVTPAGCEIQRWIV